jgi:hypothetical protein
VGSSHPPFVERKLRLLWLDARAETWRASREPAGCVARGAAASAAVRGSQSDARADKEKFYISEARAQGHRTYRSIAGYLNRKGIRTRRGCEWARQGFVGFLLARVVSADGMTPTRCPPAFGIGVAAGISFLPGKGRARAVPSLRRKLHQLTAIRSEDPAATHPVNGAKLRIRLQKAELPRFLGVS